MYGGIKMKSISRKLVSLSLVGLVGTTLLTFSSKVDAMNLLNTTPSKVYYNDGAYSGYLYRHSTWMDHNFQTNRNRWVSMYSGNVRLISRGLVPNN